MLERMTSVRLRLPTLSLLLTILLIVLGLSTVLAAQPDGPALIKVPLRDATDLERVEGTGVPVYSRLNGTDGPYLLAGATLEQIDSLRALGLDVAVLDPTTQGATYYLVAPRPGRPLAAMAAPDAILHSDGVQGVVRIGTAEAARLSASGVELAALELEPIALHPRGEAALPKAVQPDPLVADMLAKVDPADLTRYEKLLSGEEAAEIGGEAYTILSRYTYSGLPIHKATQFSYEHLASLGLEVQYDAWADASYPDVIATQRGRTRPDDIYLLSAHLDDMPHGPTAPGADDNASGVAAVLLAADILSQYEPECTFQFALWTGEEQGMLGSDAWAEWASAQGLNIRGMLNLDMIAYNSDVAPIVDLHARSWLPDSVAMANLFAAVVEAYGLDLQPDVLVDQWLGNYSDNKSFWDEGYAAILAIEDDDDFTPDYHTTADVLSTLNMPYFTEIVRASLGTFLHMSNCLTEEATGILDGHVTTAVDATTRTGATPIAAALLEISGEGGWTYEAIADSAGYYRRPLPSGTYTVTASADGYLPTTVPGIVVSAGLTTTQDFSLESLRRRVFLPLCLVGR